MGSVADQAVWTGRTFVGDPSRHRRDLAAELPVLSRLCGLPPHPWLPRRGSPLGRAARSESCAPVAGLAVPARLAGLGRRGVHGRRGCIAVWSRRRSHVPAPLRAGASGRLDRACRVSRAPPRSWVCPLRAWRGGRWLRCPRSSPPRLSRLPVRARGRVLRRFPARSRCCGGHRRSPPLVLPGVRLGAFVCPRRTASRDRGRSPLGLPSSCELDRLGYDLAQPAVLDLA